MVSNTTYVHITVDAGAAQKFYHVIWNNPEKFDNVVVHLGYFHGVIEFFGTVRKLVSGSGFGEVVYQAGFCTSGGIKGALTGKHYNRSWVRVLHESFAEAINRLFCESYIPDVFEDLGSQIKIEVEEPSVDAVIGGFSFSDYRQQYNDLKARCLEGDFGRTPQFWMQYERVIDRQQKMHLTINTNQYDLRRQCWRDSLHFCFAMNKHNYARYGTYYCRQLQQLDKTHPGAKQELMEKGLSVCRNTLNIGQSIDGATEQTFMRSYKTTGKRVVIKHAYQIICHLS